MSNIISKKSDTSPEEPWQNLLSFYIDTNVLISSLPELSALLDFHQSITTSPSLVDENYINQKRMLKLKNQFTPQLIHLILYSDFEYGVDSEVDMFIRNQMRQNALATMSWLNDIFVENFDNPKILVGILRIISRLSYYDVFPQGQTMATTAFSHSDAEVKECGVRAFENWGDLQSLTILENLQVSPPWLQDYINQVVKDLRKEFNVVVS